MHFLLISSLTWFERQLYKIIMMQLYWCTSNNKDIITMIMGLLSGSAGKESACNVGDLGSIPGLEWSPGEGKGHLLQYSGLENSMDCIVQGSQRVGHDWATFTSLTLHYNSPLYMINGVGNGNPLQYSCLENPVDRGAWWAAVYGDAQSWTRLKRLSSSSSVHN